MMAFTEQYLTDAQGNRIGVFLKIEECQQILEELEELEAIRAYDEAVSSDEEEIPFETVIAEIESQHKHK